MANCSGDLSGSGRSRTAFTTHIADVDGKKRGEQRSDWNADGKVKWRGDNHGDGTSRWTHFYPDGQKKISANWLDFKAEGAATRWDW
jgi:antitoxin component YwqK of YwqJK toxin-antitoxin module